MHSPKSRSLHFSLGSSFPVPRDPAHTAHLRVRLADLHDTTADHQLRTVAFQGLRPLDRAGVRAGLHGSCCVCLSFKLLSSGQVYHEVRSFEIICTARASNYGITSPGIRTLQITTCWTIITVFGRSEPLYTMLRSPIPNRNFYYESRAGTIIRFKFLMFLFRLATS